MLINESCRPAVLSNDEVMFADATALLPHGGPQGGVVCPFLAAVNNASQTPTYSLQWANI